MLLLPPPTLVWKNPKKPNWNRVNITYHTEETYSLQDTFKSPARGFTYMISEWSLQHCWGCKGCFSKQAHFLIKKSWELHIIKPRSLHQQMKWLRNNFEIYYYALNYPLPSQNFSNNTIFKFKPIFIPFRDLKIQDWTVF